MKIFALGFLVSLASIGVQAAQTDYYVGESIVTDLKSGIATHSPYIDQRVQDPAAGTITEVVVSKRGATFAENTSVLTVTGNSSFTMKESTGTVTGHGTLSGAAWDWNFLNAEFLMTTPGYSLRIVDYNFFAEAGSILAHKDFYLTLPGSTDEKLIQQEDVVLHAVDAAAFSAKRQELLKNN